ncbi:scavenger receptor class F member 2, partial [Elysia marginata]
MLLVRFQLLTFVLLTWATLTSGQCKSRGWFGQTSCKYLCHCYNEVQCDWMTGKCPGRCAKGWFGPACQYVSSRYRVRSPSLLQPTLSNGDDNSCVPLFAIQAISDLSPFQEILIDFDAPMLVTWVRIVGISTAQAASQNVKIEGLGGSSPCDPSKSQTVIQVDKTMDIFCEAFQPVGHLKLQFMQGISELCSLYISGGRNVALRQKTSQTTTWSTYWVSGNAVNGKLGTIDGGDSVLQEECTHTALGHGDQSWTVEFSNKCYFSQIVIYNRRNPSRVCCEDRLKGFLLTAYNGYTEIFNHRDHIATKQDVYTVVNSQSKGLTGPVTKIEIVKNRRSPILTLCEVMVFGDVICPTGRYGRDCGSQCNCADHGACIVSTGGCPGGCAPGYMGEDCSTVCPDGKFGSGCKKTCSVHCEGYNDRCIFEDGSCVHGCEVGYQPPLCDTACNVGHYGPNCAEQCSVHCVGDTYPCSPKDGKCDLGCEPGYQPPTCDQ